MYRPALRTQPWITSMGYVCHRCRHRLANQQKGPTAHTQTRHESIQVGTAADTGVDVDDWFSNFNSLSEDTHNDSQTIQTVRAEQTKEKEKSPSRIERRKRQRVAPPAEDEALRGLAKAVGGVQGMEALNASLATRVDGKAAEEDTEVEKSGTAFRRAGSSPRSATAKRQSKRREKKRSNAQYISRGEATPGFASVDHPVETGNTAAEAIGKERAKFEDIMASLETAVALQQTSGVDALLEELEARKEKPAPADEVEVPEGLTNRQEGGAQLANMRPRRPIAAPDFPFPAKADASVAADAMPEQSENVQGEEAPLAMREAAATASVDSIKETDVQRTYTFGALRKPQSLAAKVREASSRQTWGGLASAAESAKAGKASFDSLRKADKVSVKPQVRTAGEWTAWGSELVQRAAFGSTAKAAPDDAANKELLEPVVDVEVKEGQDNDAGGQHSSTTLSSASFDSLYEELNRRVGGHAAEAVSAEAAASKKRGARVAAAPTEPSGQEPTSETVEATDTGAQGPNAVEGMVPQPESEGAETAKLSRWKRTAFRKLTSSTWRKISGPRPEEPEVPHRDESKERHEAKMLHAVAKSGKSSASAEREAAGTGDGKSEDTLETDGENGSTDDAMERLAKLHERTDATSVSALGQSEGHKSLAEVKASSSHAADTETQEKTAFPAPDDYQPPMESSDIRSLTAGDLEVSALNIQDQPSVPPLQYGLDRVLFNPGVYQMQDPHSRTYNFDPYLQSIMPVSEFDFNALKEYKTSSQDGFLGKLANEHGKKYVGSTSSMTGTLGQFHYLLSNWRPINLNMLSKGFHEQLDSFTQINRAPNAIFLRYKADSGTYAIDADKEFDGANVLMMLGKSMEKLLTLPKDQYERYRHTNTTDPITAAEKNETEAFEYTTMGDFLMRSQLDAHDARLPGTGMFDLKTRAVVSIRMDIEGYEDMLGYEIFTLQGRWESYEREYYDMMRSTMLKYMLQARMGRMDGIFVAYHNIERIFGFQYLPIREIDRAMHGQVDPCLGEQEFRISLRMLNEVLEMATKQFPEKSLRLHFEAAGTPANVMWVFAEPMEEKEIEGIQGKSKEKVAEFEANVMGIERKPAAAARSHLEAEGEAESEKAAPATQGSAGEAEASADSPNETTSTNTSAPSSPETSDYASTASSADPNFYNKISAQLDKNLKPLFAATLIIQNFINGTPCEDNRPFSLKPKDNWEVQYILKEAPIGLPEKWARYEDCKARRKHTLAKASLEEGDAGDGEEGGTVGAREPRKESWYTRVLKEMVGRGRDFRKAVDELEEGREKVVVGGAVPVGRAQSGGVKDVASSPAEGEDKLDGVDGYMQWLYKKVW